MGQNGLWPAVNQSILDVESDSLMDAVSRVRESAQHKDGERIAVLVQSMIHPVCAGVAFTADPVTGDRLTTIVTATAGVADRLVSGHPSQSSSASSRPCWSGATRSSPSTTPTGSPTAASKAPTTSSACSRGPPTYGIVNTDNFAARFGCHGHRCRCPLWGGPENGSSLAGRLRQWSECFGRPQFEA